MTILYRFIIFIIAALLAGPLFALTINLLIASGVFANENLSYNFGEDVTRKAILIWGIGLAFGLTSIFVEGKKRIALLVTTLVAPSIFAILYALTL